MATRRQEQRSVNFGNWVKRTLSSNNIDPLALAVVEQLCSRYAPDAEVLYIGDTKEKFAFRDKERMDELGCATEVNGKMPDAIVFNSEKGWFFLLESSTSHGPIDAKRRAQFASLFSSVKADLVYMSAFPDRGLMAKYLGVISWETEVWVADAPEHLIHFNGDKFIGPHTNAPQR